MLALLTVLILLTTGQIATLLYFGRKILSESRDIVAPVEDDMAEEAAIYVTIDQMETLTSQLQAYIDHRIDTDTTSTEQFGDLSEHVDSILDIVTSLATESEQTNQDMVNLVDRVSRLAFNGSTTKQLLDKTIDNIDWGDDDSDDFDAIDNAIENIPVATEADIANLPPLRGTGTPYRPPAAPTPSRAPAVPSEPLPVAPPAPVKAPTPVEDLEPVPLKEARADGDPMITDLRAEPFADHPDATHDLHELPMSGQYEEMGAVRGRSRRTRRL